MRHVASFTGDETISLREVIEHLNGALAKDRAAITRLVLQRVACNPSLVNDAHLAQRAGVHEIGMLGLLNGMFGADHRGNGQGGGITVTMQGNAIQVFAFNPTPPVAASATAPRTRKPVAEAKTRKGERNAPPVSKRPVAPIGQRTRRAGRGG